MLSEDEKKKRKENAKKTQLRFAQRVKQMRILHRYTQAGLADYFDKSEATVRAWESATAIPPSTTLVELAELFDCTVDFLLGKSDVPNPEVGETMNKRVEMISTAFVNLPGKTGVRILNGLSALIDEGNKNGITEPVLRLFANMLNGLVRATGTTNGELTVINRDKDSKRVKVNLPGDLNAMRKAHLQLEFIHYHQLDTQHYQNAIFLLLMEKVVSDCKKATSNEDEQKIITALYEAYSGKNSYESISQDAMEYYKE